MKNLLLLITLFALFSCTSDNEPWNNACPTTRSGGDFSNYFFGMYSDKDTYKFDCLGKIVSQELPYITSYCTKEDGYNNIWLELVSKPEWVDTVMIATVYEKICIAMPQLQNNNSMEERSGRIVLRQKESNKILSYNILQGSKNNRIRVKVDNPTKNHFIFSITTDYPVENSIRILIPFDIYNDVEEWKNQIAQIVLSKGQSTGSYIMNYDAAPIVAIHGDLKGYRLHEGDIITSDDIYTYTFVRYW